MNESRIEEIIRVFNRRLTATPTEFHRYLFYEIDWEDKLIGIKGPRGCGKTTLLLQHIKQSFHGQELEKVLYVSLDNIWFADNKILDLVDFHYNHGGTHIFIDEIHYEPKWQTMLKNMSDNYPGMYIVYTGSSMLEIDAHEGDLSRRQVMYEMRGMSFREYLEYEGVVKHERLTLEQLMDNHVEIAMDICSRTNVLGCFNKYLREGYYPFYKAVRQGFDSRLLATVNQVIESDYPQIDDVTVATIRKTKKMLMVLSECVPQLPNMSQLYRELETDRNNGLKMLRALERGGLLLLLGSKAKSINQLSRPDKIYINNPTLMYALSPRADIGSVRETFFMNQLSQSHELSYPKAGDFLVDGRYLFEVGGKGKTFSQIKDIPDSYLAVDDTEIGRGARIPLWLFGMLY
ncbi:MAG: AAA family ATPase [Prevotella sp.]|uniref:ATP-binding protein n=1 Tax=Prevotella sp. P3-122 TaxID=2024223 RepID=UPI000B96D994|nr:AAA family ATPase [Prevotella sp. P3-122]MDD6590657.1 AAA family ATPase [Prevotella sp.]MDY3272449.1 AAA family ATPase [Prevotella sp.]MDY3671393.1 AAA family ATPase [Prevotella sp.]MDY3897814.1 AAA family ATPase [Prevotella sp.]MDY5850035.1 AAA family ATPase [Prevotella sp.]